VTNSTANKRKSIAKVKTSIAKTVKAQTESNADMITVTK